MVKLTKREKPVSISDEINLRIGLIDHVLYGRSETLDNEDWIQAKRGEKKFLNYLLSIIEPKEENQ